jgi:drug/metabolite transporter (DMT)-like permease
MRPLGWIGVALIVAGGIVLAMRGVSYTKSRNEVDLGPIRFGTVEKGFVPPIAGVAAMLVGACLVFAGRRRPE